MKSRDFCFWLQGFFELNRAPDSKTDRGLTQCQIEMIKAHLDLVFKHEIDPEMGDKAVQEVLNDIHTVWQEPPKVKC